MFVPIPIVPYCSNTTVVNKNIVYSDTVLNLKEIGSNLKVTTLSNVSEFELGRCIEKIFKNNENVIFNTIQYSKNDKKVYFYTDKEIITKEWEESKIFKYKTITNKVEILGELKNILSSSKSKDPNVVSLLSIYRVLLDKTESYSSMKSKFESQIDRKIKNKYSSDSYCVIYDFDYDKNVMKVGFQEYGIGDVNKIKFKKKDGDLYILSSESCFYANEHLVYLGEELSELYDKFLLYKSYIEETKSRISSINSNFKVSIFPTSLSVSDNTYPHQFNLNMRIKDNKYDYDCNSYEIIDTIKGSESELFENIYVTISDCPIWMQEELKKVRYDELVNEDRIEKETAERKRLEELDRQLKERKKQKKLELKRKLFPWIK